MKILIVVLFLGVLVSLGSAMKYLMQDRGCTDRMAWALTWRVGLSILLFLFLLLAYALGWISPNMG
ncbi:twin transmembrane helix small protein [Castellaniella ginsengisoli]